MSNTTRNQDDSTNSGRGENSSDSDLEFLRRLLENTEETRKILERLPGKFEDDLILKARIAKDLVIGSPTVWGGEAVVNISLESKDEMANGLTPYYLANNVSEYLMAIENIQLVIDRILGRTTKGITIKAISYHSPLSVSLAGAAEAVQTLEETIVPWKRKHAETMSRLIEQYKQIEIESKKAEVLDKRASAAKNRAEAEKLKAEAAQQRELLKKMELENERTRLDLNRARIQLVLDVINQIAPNLTEADRISYLLKLLPPLDITILSNLELS